MNYEDFITPFDLNIIKQLSIIIESFSVPIISHDIEFTFSFTGFSNDEIDKLTDQLPMEWFKQ